MLLSILNFFLESRLPKQQKQPTQGEAQGGHDGEAQAEAPAPGQISNAVVDELQHIVFNKVAIGRFAGMPL